MVQISLHWSIRISFHFAQLCIRRHLCHILMEYGNAFPSMFGRLLGASLWGMVKSGLKLGYRYKGSEGAARVVRHVVQCEHSVHANYGTTKHVSSWWAVGPERNDLVMLVVCIGETLNR